MSKKRVFRRETKSISEQVEDHFKYMSHKGARKQKIVNFKDPLWRPNGNLIE